MALSGYDFGACARHIGEMATRPIEGEAYVRFRERFFALYRDFPCRPSPT